MAGFDRRDAGIFREPADVRDYVRPRLATIACYLEVAVIRPRPNDARILGRLRDRVNCRVHLGRRVVDRDAPGLLLALLRGIVRRQIRRDALPRLPKITRPEEELRSDIDRAALRGTNVDGRVPVESQLLLLVMRQWLDIARLMRAPVDAADRPTLGFCVEVVGIGRIDEHPEAVTAVHVFTLVSRDAARIFRRPDPGAVVLEAAVDVIGPVHVDTDVIELRDGQVVALPPLIAGVVRIPQTAVVPRDQVIGVVRIHPYVVEIAVRSARDVAEALPTVRADDETAVWFVDAIRFTRIDDQIGEVERPPDHVLAAIEHLPRLAAVVGAIQP